MEEVNRTDSYQMYKMRGVIDFPYFTPSPGGGGGVDAGVVNQIKGEIAGLDQAVVGLQTKTDGLQTAINLFTTDEALRDKVRTMETTVAKNTQEIADLDGAVTNTLGTVGTTVSAHTSRLAALEAANTQNVKDISDLDSTVTTLKSIASTNIVTHRDYLHQLLTLDRDVPLAGTPGAQATSANLYLPINSYQENEAKFKNTGRFRGYEGRNTLMLLFHLVSLPRVFSEQKLRIQDYLNVQFQVLDLANQRVHAQVPVLLNDYVNSESLTLVPMHFVLKKDANLVVVFRFTTTGIPFPPEGGLKISKTRTALLHFVPLFANLGGKVNLKSHPDVEDLLSAPPFEDFAELAVRMIHHTEPVPPFYVHHRLYVRNVSLSMKDLSQTPAGTGVRVAITGGVAFYCPGANTTWSNVGVSKTTNQLIYNVSSVASVGGDNTQLHRRFHIFGFVMPEYVYFGLEGYPIWLDVNGFNMRPGTVAMSVQVYGFIHPVRASYGLISDEIPTINEIRARPPRADDLAGFPRLEFLAGTKAHACNQLSALTVQFPSVHDSVHFSGGGALVDANGVVNWQTISDQYPASPRYNLGVAPPNTAYSSIGIFFCPKDFSGTPLNYLMSDVTIFGFGNDGSEGILGEGVFRSSVTPNGYPPENDDVWFPV